VISREQVPFCPTEFTNQFGINGHGPHVLDVFERGHREDGLAGDSEVIGVPAL
jgi:hypothetical protein